MLINQLIDQRLFTHHFQPVYNIEDNQIIGFEVLLRSELFPNPELAFEAARRADRLFDLDTASIEGAIQTFCQAPISSSPSLLRSEEHTSELQSRGHLVCRLLL